MISDLAKVTIIDQEVHLSAGKTSVFVKCTKLCYCEGSNQLANYKISHKLDIANKYVTSIYIIKTLLSPKYKLYTTDLVNSITMNRTKYMSILNTSIKSLTKTTKLNYCQKTREET